MKEKFKFYLGVFKDTFKAYSNSDAIIESAGLAYSAVFSIPGLLIIIIWGAGLFFGEEMVRGEISRQVAETLGNDAAESIQNIIQNAMIDKDNFWMKAVGVGALAFGATTIFFMLQKSLNNLWGIEPKPKQALIKYVLDRVNSLGLIIVISLLMAITMILSTIISGMSHIITEEFGMRTYTIAQIVNFGVGFLLVMMIFAIIFKVLPDVKIQWRAVYTGAFVTALLFTLGKFLLSFYFAQFEPTSVYGTAGSIILVMLWVNYTFQIVLFGAQFTKINAIRNGYNFEPDDHATWEGESEEVVTDKNKIAIKS